MKIQVLSSQHLIYRGLAILSIITAYKILFYFLLTIVNSINGSVLK